MLSGNRNFEGRINPLCRANYLASPPLVVAYALAGRMDFDIVNESLGNDKSGKPVYLRDIWPTPDEVETTMRSSVTSEMFRKEYADVFTGDEHWRALPIPEGDLYAWDEKSTYIKHPPYFENMPLKPRRAAAICTACARWRCLAIASPPITFRPPARFPRYSRRKISDRDTACSPRISIPTARAAAITK